MQCSPGKSCDKCAGRVREHLCSSAVASEGMIVPVLERRLTWLACARGTRAKEVECDEDYAGGTERQGEHGYAGEEGRGGTGGGERSFAKAINGECGGEEEGDEGEVIVEHGVRRRRRMRDAGGDSGRAPQAHLRLLSGLWAPLWTRTKSTLGASRGTVNDVIQQCFVIRWPRLSHRT
jgi:hypothetical protein